MSGFDVEFGGAARSMAVLKVRKGKKVLRKLYRAEENCESFTMWHSSELWLTQLTSPLWAMEEALTELRSMSVAAPRQLPTRPA